MMRVSNSPKGYAAPILIPSCHRACDSLQIGYPFEVDEMLRYVLPPFHRHEEVGPSCENPGFLTISAKKIQGLGEGCGRMIVQIGAIA